MAKTLVGIYFFCWISTAKFGKLITASPATACLGYRGVELSDAVLLFRRGWRRKPRSGTTVLFTGDRRPHRQKAMKPLTTYFQVFLTTEVRINLHQRHLLNQRTSAVSEFLTRHRQTTRRTPMAWICVSLTPPRARDEGREGGRTGSTPSAHPCRPALFNLASMGSSLNMAHTLLKKTVCSILSRKAPMPLKPL